MMGLNTQIKVFSIFDKQRGKFLQPFFHETIADMFQNIQMIVAKGNTHMSMYPHNYTVHYIADWIQDRLEAEVEYMFDETISKKQYTIEEIMENINPNKKEKNGKAEDKRTETKSI